MGTIKLSQGRAFAPFYGWTRQDYERALLEVVPASPAVPWDSPKGVRQADAPRGLSGLLEAIGKPSAWMADALCKEYADVDWFAEGVGSTDAIAVCSKCLVRSECLEAGQAGREVGTWGATTSRERAAMRRAEVA